MNKQASENANRFQAYCKQAFERYAARLENAELPAVLEGFAWYDEARRMISAIALATMHPEHRVAELIAVLSPRAKWSRNVRVAIDMLNDPHNRPSGVMQALFKQAQGVLFNDTTANGPKTREFANALKGDYSAVPIDIHMMNAAGFNGRNAPTPYQRRACQFAIKALAVQYGIEPARMQAIIWVLVRGRSN
jgi:AcrR family transcriptional regulator